MKLTNCYGLIRLGEELRHSALKQIMSLGDSSLASVFLLRQLSLRFNYRNNQNKLITTHL